MSNERQKPSSAIICPTCGHKNTPVAQICLICDTPLQTEIRLTTKPIHSGGLLRKKSRDDEPAHEPETDNFPNQVQAMPEDEADFDDFPRRKTNTRHQCPDCGHMNRIGTFVCVECGCTLLGNNSGVSDMDTQEAETIRHDYVDTQMVPQVRIDPFEQEAINQSVHVPAERDYITPLMLHEPINDVPLGCFKFTHWMVLRLEIISQHASITIQPRRDKSMLIGRSHESLPVQPDIDLSPYLGGTHGVSRRHALIRLNGTSLEIQDMNSTNGTSINGIRFYPKAAHQLRHGDVLMLGQVQLRVSFIAKTAQANKGLTDELSFND